MHQPMAHQTGRQATLAGQRPQLLRTTHGHHQVWVSRCRTPRRTPRLLVANATGFEPQMPGAAQLASMMVVMTSTLTSGLYWWFVVVPSERAALSKEKRRGAVKEYLEELEEDPSRGAERWFYTEWREKLQKRKQLNAWGDASSSGPPSTSLPQASSTTTSATTAEGSSAATEEDKATTQQPSREAQPNPDLLKPSFETPMPSFWNLDNPLVLTAVGLGLLVGVAAVVGGPKPGM